MMCIIEELASSIFRWLQECPCMGHTMIGNTKSRDRQVSVIGCLSNGEH